jgi:hypothetical protein
MAEWFREYQFMTITHCTHEEYLDTPLQVIERTLRIHSVVEDARAKAQAASTPSIPTIT